MSPYTNTYPCSIEGCEKPRVKGGMCSMHFSRFKRTGDPLVSRRIIGDSDTRFWSKVDKDGPIPTEHPELGPCWVWVGYINDDGYGIFSVGQELMKAHHFSAGKPNKGFEWHHLCDTKPCVRPDHVKLLTRSQHRIQDGSPQAKHLRDRTHCPHGHPYDEVNTYFYRGERRCKTCIRERDQRRRATSA